MNFLVTGYKGFIGNNIYRFLQTNNNYKVDGVSRNDKLPNKNYDVIIHCAGMTPSKAKCDFDYIEDNVNHTQKIINKYCTSKIIFISSIGIYGSPLDKIITENTIPYKQSFYGISKYISEQLIINSTNKYIILRLPTVIGNNSPSTFITRMLDNIQNKSNINIVNGDNKFNSIIHMDEINLVIKFVISGNKFYKDTYNIASNNYIYIKDLPQIISKELSIKPSNITYQNNDNFNGLISIDNIQKYIKLPNTEDTIMKYLKEQVKSISHS